MQGVYQQVQGIPMGTKPAVFIANDYLYELGFCRQLAACARLGRTRLRIGDTAERARLFFADPAANAAKKPWAALHILRTCHFNTRYVDNLVSFANPAWRTWRTPELAGLHWHLPTGAAAGAGAQRRRILFFPGPAHPGGRGHLGDRCGWLGGGILHRSRANLGGVQLQRRRQPVSPLPPHPYAARGL